MKKKGTHLLILFALSLVFALVFAGCDNNDDKGNSESENKTSTEESVVESTYSVWFENKTLSLIVGEEQALIADFDKQEGLTLSYSSSDSGVASVDEYGRVTGVSEGQATITVAYGQASDTCAVTVGFNGLLPLLQLDGITEDNICINRSAEVDLTGKVLFNGKTYTDATIEYTVSNPSVGGMEDGMFKPLALGKTEITVSATWRGATGSTLNKTVEVEVVAEFQFAINNGISEITLFTENADNQSIESPFVITAIYEGSPLDTTVTITAGTDYIQYDAENEKVTSLGQVGEAEISVSYVIENETTVTKVPVHVKHTMYVYDGLVENFSVIHGDTVTGTAIAEIVGADIVSAYDEDGTELEVTGNKLFGVKDSKTGKFESTITVYTATRGYSIAIEGYTGIITKAEDLAMFNVNAFYGKLTAEDSGKAYHPIDDSKPIQMWEGYYVLANNIDATNYAHASNGEAIATRGIQSGGHNLGLHGTFDGCGYTIKGISLGANGMFGHIVNGAVKNVAFVDVTLRNEDYATVLSAWIIDSEISNVFVTIANESALSKIGTAFACGANTSTFTACLVVTKPGFSYTSEVKLHGSFLYGNRELLQNNETVSTYSDVYVVSGDYLGYNKSSTFYTAAENETIEIDGFATHTLNGVKKYATVAAMQAQDNAYTNFNAAYWTVENGMPVWNNYNGEYPSQGEPETPINPEDIPEGESVGGFDVGWL